MNGTGLLDCTSTKFLGVTLESTLSWNEHCLQLANKISSKAYAFRCLRLQVPTSCLISLYYAEVQSRLQYGIMLWDSSAAANGVFTAQKAVLRCIVGARRDESCRLIFRQLNILPLACLYIVETCCYVYNNKNCFATNAEVHNYCTRSMEDLHTSNRTLTVTRQGVESIGINIFNKLPSTTKTVKTFKQFRRLVKEYVTQHSFYTIAEYLQL